MEPERVGNGLSDPAIFAVLPGGDPELVLERRFEGAVGSWSPSREECLEPGQSYAWVVRAEPFGKEGVEGEVVWSMPRRFRVDAAPSAEELAAALEVVARWQRVSEQVSAVLPPLQERSARERGTSAGAPKSGALQRAARSASRIPELAEAPEGVGVVSAVRGEVADLTGFTAGSTACQSSAEDGAGVLGEALSLTGNV